MSKKKQKMIVDTGMVVLLPMLMAYSLIGEVFHEIAGTLMMILTVIHLIQNRKWLAAIPRGRYAPKRVFQTVLDLMLIVLLVLQPLSGILMSRHLYTFIQIPGISSLMRQLHMVLAYWGFVLISLHAGTHLIPAANKLRNMPTTAKSATSAGVAVMCVYGVYAFLKRQIPAYMFMRSMFVFFDYSESRVRFFVDYLAVMALFTVLSLVITVGLSAFGRKMR